MFKCLTQEWLFCVCKSETASCFLFFLSGFFWSTRWHNNGSQSRLWRVPIPISSLIFYFGCKITSVQLHLLQFYRHYNYGGLCKEFKFSHSLSNGSAAINIHQRHQRLSELITVSADSRCPNCCTDQAKLIYIITFKLLYKHGFFFFFYIPLVSTGITIWLHSYVWGRQTELMEGDRERNRGRKWLWHVWACPWSLCQCLWADLECQRQTEPSDPLHQTATVFDFSRVT